MKKIFKEAEYSFSFEHNLKKDSLVEPIIIKYFECFNNPENVEEILNVEQYSVYKEIMEFVEHEQSDYVCRTIDVIDSDLFDFDYESNNDSEFYVGFRISRLLQEKDVSRLLIFVINPLMEFFGFKPLNKYFCSIDYNLTETIAGTV